MRYLSLFLLGLCLVLPAQAETTLSLRVTNSNGLGDQDAQLGFELDHFWSNVHLDIVTTYTEKVDGGEGIGFRGVIEYSISNHLYLGVRATYLDLSGYSKSGGGVVLTYFKDIDEQLLLRARAYGPNIEDPNEYGVGLRVTAQITQRWVSSIELEKWWFEGGRPGRRIVILVGPTF